MTIIVRELTDARPDPDCLHCVLPYFIADFCNAHPDLSGDQIASQLGQALGEVIASALHNADQAEDLEQVLEAIGEIVRTAAEQNLATFKARRS